MSVLRKRLRTAVGILVLCGIIPAVFWYVAPYFTEDPMPRIMEQTPARVYHDCRGNRIYAERTYDCQWRFEIPLNELPPHVLTTLLAVEDRKFYRHGGVNYMAGLRALFQNLTGGRIISGASTITMQLAAMAEPDRKRTLSRKFMQILRARKLEHLYSKERILTEYINRIPFGGKIYGFEAAANYYFGLPASKLNLAEASLLCGLPQKPNRFRPDRSFANARSRQRLVLQALVHHNILDAGEAKRIYDSEPLRLRDFTRPSPFRQLSQAPYIHYCREALREAGGGSVIHTALDPELERMVRNVLVRRRDSLEGVHDAAAVLIDNATGEIRVMIGTLDFHDPRGGQVNAALASRSAGSALKPFLYAEAAGGGILIAETVLDDSPLRYGDYAPGNYDASYMGRVSASTALSHSLNTPVIRLLARLGTERVNTLFRRLHLPPGKSDTGLPFALGTVGYDLLSLTAAYTVFPCGGKFRNPGFLLRGAHAEPEAQVFPPGAAFMVAEILRQLPLPDSVIKGVAWKTGTSNGNHDAWCFAFTEDYTLGVWFGNKDGTPSPALVGVTAAAPAAAQILNALYRFRKPPGNGKRDRYLELIRLCGDCGLAVSPACEHLIQGYAVRGVPLEVCSGCRSKKPAVKIISPLPGNYLAERKSLRMKLSSENGRKLHWYLDGKYLGEFSERHLEIGKGSHTLQARRGDATSSVIFSVDRKTAR